MIKSWFKKLSLINEKIKSLTPNKKLFIKGFIIGFFSGGLFIIIFLPLPISGKK